MKTHYLVLFFTILAFGCGQNLSKDTLRESAVGEIIGKDGDNNTYVWKGIPFAEPPVKDLRWKAPVYIEKLKERYEASEFKKACFQRPNILEAGDSKNWEGSEDCLYLNIWTPKLAKEGIKAKKLPVMMWIHGGGNTVGSAHVYDPSSLVSKFNVVVVTIQYRMGPLGWFRHPALVNQTSSLEDKSGNFGTLDTIMALRWINENIDSFGGDPGNVTVFGESAGGHNTAAIYASPLASGLFHKAIVQSGIVSVSSIKAAESYLPNNRIAPTTSSLEIFNQILVLEGRASGLSQAKTIQEGMSKKQIKEILLKSSPENILRASRKARPERSGMTRVFPDGKVILDGGISEAFTNPDFYRVPIIFGTNKDENKFFNSLNRNFVEWKPAEGLYKQAGIDEMPTKIIDPDYYDAVSFYGSSEWKHRAVDKPAKLLTKSGFPKAYAYRFDWDELRTVNSLKLSQLIGAAHALEILFVMGTFDNFIIKNFFFEEGSFEPAKLLSEQIQSYWAEFAYTGKPGRGRQGDLPLWSSWGLGSSDKYLVLDSSNDKGIYMSDVEYTKEYLLSKLKDDIRLNDQEKCETLFGISYGDGAGFTTKEFSDYDDGICVGRDYTDLINMIQSVESEIIKSEDKPGEKT